MNGVDFPVDKVLDGIAAAREAGFGPIKVNMVVRRGINEYVGRRRWPAGRGPRATSSGSSSTWTSATRTAGGSTRSSRPREVVAAISARDAARAGPAELPGRGRRSLALRRRRRRGRRHRLGDRAVLRGLHPGPDLGRRPALHLPVRGQGHRPARARSAAGRSDADARPRRSGRSGRSGPTATPSSDPRRRPTCPGSRCSRWAASAPRLALVHRSSTGGWKVVDTLADGSRRSSWTSALTLAAAARNVGLARRGRQGPGHWRSHQRCPASTGRFGRFAFPEPAISPSRRRDVRGDVTGIPVSVLPPGERRRKPGRSCRAFSLVRDRSLRLPQLAGAAHGRAAEHVDSGDDPTLDPSRPIPPAEQPARWPRSRRPSGPGPTSSRRSGSSSGSGLGGLADDLVDPVAIPFADLPGWPAATAPGHVGRLLLGRLDGRPGGDAPGPAPHVRGQRRRASSSSRSCSWAGSGRRSSS